MTERTEVCWACRRRLPLEDLLAFGPRSQPGSWRFVCRPEIRRERTPGAHHVPTQICFRVVPSARTHDIRPAIELENVNA